MSDETPTTLLIQELREAVGRWDDEFPDPDDDWDRGHAEGAAKCAGELRAILSRWTARTVIS